MTHLDQWRVGMAEEDDLGPDPAGMVSKSSHSPFDSVGVAVAEEERDIAEAEKKFTGEADSDVTVAGDPDEGAGERGFQGEEVVAEVSQVDDGIDLLDHLHGPNHRRIVAVGV